MKQAMAIITISIPLPAAHEYLLAERQECDVHHLTRCIGLVNDSCLENDVGWCDVMWCVVLCCAAHECMHACFYAFIHVVCNKHLSFFFIAIFFHSLYIAID